MYLGALVGLSQEEFWNTTPRYLDACRRAYESNFRSGWEQARFVAFFVVKTVDSKNRFKSEQSLVRFPWEVKEDDLPVPTEQEWQKVDEEMDEALKVLNPKVYEEYMKGKQAAQTQKQQRGNFSAG